MKGPIQRRGVVKGLGLFLRDEARTSGAGAAARDVRRGSAAWASEAKGLASASLLRRGSTAGRLQLVSLVTLLK